MVRFNLRSIEVFRAVCDAGSVTEAAGSLCVTQPAVSKAIGQLEMNLGIRLFSRAHGRVFPTADGQRLYAESERFFAHVATFQDTLSDLGQSKVGKVIAGAVPTLAGSLLASAASRVLARLPMAKIELIACQATSVTEEATRHRIDFGLTHSAVDDQSIDVQLLGESEIVAVMAIDHPLARNTVVTPQDLAGTHLIMLDGGSPPSHLVRSAFAAENVVMSVAMEVNSSSIAHTAARDGLGVALIDPWSSLSTYGRDVAIKPFLPRVALRIYAIHSVLRPPSRLATTMLGELSSILADVAIRSPFIRHPSARHAAFEDEPPADRTRAMAALFAEPAGPVISPQ